MAINDSKQLSQKAERVVGPGLLGRTLTGAGRTAARGPGEKNEPGMRALLPPQLGAGEVQAAHAPGAVLQESVLDTEAVNWENRSRGGATPGTYARLRFQVVAPGRFS